MNIINFGYDGVLVDDESINLFRGAPPGYFNGLHNDLSFYHDNSIFNIPKYYIEKLFNISFPIRKFDSIEESHILTTFPYLIHSLKVKDSIIGYLEKGVGSSTYPYTVVEKHYDEFLKNKEYFLFPYFPNNDYFFSGDNPLPLPPKEVIEAAKNGVCKIVFIYLNEGHIYRYEHFKKLYELAINTNLTSKEIEFYHCNLKIKETAELYINDIGNYINFKPISFFEIDLWFFKDFNRFYKDQTLKGVQEITEPLLKDYRSSIKPKKFLCLNRMGRGHRYNIISFLYSQKELSNNSLYSIGPIIGKDIEEKKLSFDALKLASTLLFQNYKDIGKFFDDHESELMSTGVVLDEPEFEYKNLADNINIDLHRQTYISIITETEVNKHTIFFSEKIFKPISVYHPFILIGSPESLKKLREFGYKTFGQWWDESYDEEYNYKIRMNKIAKLILKLNKLSLEELQTMIIEMEPVLKHNHNLLFNNQRHTHLIDELICTSSPVEVSNSTIPTTVKYLI